MKVETDFQAKEILKLSTIYFITTTERVTLSWYNRLIAYLPSFPFYKALISQIIGNN